MLPQACVRDCSGKPTCVRRSLSEAEAIGRREDTPTNSFVNSLLFSLLVAAGNSYSRQ